MSSDGIWVRHGKTYYKTNPSEPATVPVGVYELGFSQLAGFFITLTRDKFEFPHKVYGYDKPFINRVIRSYNENEPTKQLGVILNGTKGAGKTLTAKLICAEINLPVILIGTYFENIPNFIASIDFPCVIMIDEYEKLFSEDAERDAVLLQCLDGPQAPASKCLFLLTMNELFINENMKNRPSRIRYIKQYRDLPKETILEIIEDKLKDQSKKDELIDGLKSLELITTDLLIQIIEEVNLHGDNLKDFLTIFNCGRGASNVVRKYDIVNAKTEELIFKGVNYKCSFINSNDVEHICGRWIEHNDEHGNRISLMVCRPLPNGWFEVRAVCGQYSGPPINAATTNEPQRLVFTEDEFEGWDDDEAAIPLTPALPLPKSKKKKNVISLDISFAARFVLVSSDSNWQFSY